MAKFRCAPAARKAPGSTTRSDAKVEGLVPCIEVAGGICQSNLPILHGCGRPQSDSISIGSVPQHHGTRGKAPASAFRNP